MSTSSPTVFPSIVPSTPARVLSETPAATPFPALELEEWRSRWPWLLQGITTAGAGGEWDMALFGEGATKAAVDRWETLIQALPVQGVAHARQVHGSAVRVHGPGEPGLRLVPRCDGHLTRVPGLLLAATVADCVPAYLVAPESRTVGVVHAGWRGAAGGILEGAIGRLRDRFGSPASELHVHLGPSICGDCYEVGPEVFDALGEPVPDGPEMLDLRGNLARRAVARGVPRERVTVSAHCTRCGPAALFSHRGGNMERQIAFIGVARGG